MIKEHLDWKYFDWKEFQTLCIAIAEMIVPDCNFSEYLKPGQRQEGIDLISFMRKEGKFFCIQCKREENLCIRDLQKIIALFRSGEYFEKSSDFVIATSAELQNSELQIFINTTKIELYNECGLVFDCWDRTIIETHLQKRYDLVAAYFGQLQAEEFCYPQMRYERIQKMEPLANYIPRKLIKLADKNKNKEYKWDFSPVTTFNLIDLVTGERSKAARICIVGDAYQGKSSYIRQTVVQLQETHHQLQPIFLQIKEYNVQPIVELLSKIYGEWKNIPLRDIVLIIDGLDEVPTERFTEMINHIREFTLAYCPVSLIFSCRKLFFAKYNIAGILTDFDTYDLYSLQHGNVDSYINSTLGDLSEPFKTAASLSGISGLLFHPFYLVNIVEEYNRPPHQLPGSKVKVIDSLINRSFDIARYRKIKGSESVNDEMYQFNNVVERFAFALQLAGANSFSSDIVQELFNSDERLLLQHNSLITQSETNWTFINALFQEHIAARKLSKMDFENILIHCTVGYSVKKIKTKWIQTISSLLSVLDIGSDLFEQIFRLTENDNIELLFQTESSKYEETLRLSILQKLMEKCIRLNIRTIIIYEDTVGFFIQQSASCKEYLLSLLFKKTITIRIRVVCCRILRYSMLDEKQQKKYAEFVLSELASTTDTYYAANLIQVFSSHKYGDAEVVQKLIMFKELNRHHEYRDEVYELITALRLADRFYDYGLKGIPYLINHNKEITQGGSEHNIEEFLLSSVNPIHITQLLDRFREDEWASYFERRSITVGDFFKKIIDKLTGYFSAHPYMIFTIAGLIKDLGRKYLREEFKEIDSFLEKTNSHWLIVRILVNDIFNDNNWQTGSLITYDCYDYILFEFEEGDYEISQLRSCIGGLRYKHKDEIADNFYQLCIDATEGAIINNEAASLHNLYLEAEKRKYENDLIYIRSLEAFKEGLINYFKAYGKNTISEDDLFIDIENNIGALRQSSDSYFLYYYLVRWNENRKSANLDDCLKQLDKDGYFEIFQAEEILHYHRRTEETDRVLMPLLKDYYDRALPTANFQNCLWIEGGMYYQKNKEFRIGEIFQKFAFDTPEQYLMELVWLDNDGTRGFETATLNKRQTISQMILDRLSPAGKIEFRKKIVENIRTGIKLESVLGTHVALCRHLKITEAKEDILECLKNMHNEHINKTDAVDTYLDLGGNSAAILPLLQSMTGYNDYFFYFLTIKLYKIYSQEVSSKLKEALSCSDTSKENKIKFAQMLAELGDFDAFAYLVNEVRITLKAPYHIQGGHQLGQVDTRKALEVITPLMYLVVDRKFDNNRSFHDTAKSIVLEWLNTFAAKSEDDLNMVITFLEETMQTLKGEFEDVRDLNWYINRMLEEFRSSDKTVKTIPEIKTILAGITD